MRALRLLRRLLLSAGDFVVGRFSLICFVSPEAVRLHLHHGDVNKLENQRDEQTRF